MGNGGCTKKRSGQEEARRGYKKRETKVGERRDFTSQSHKTTNQQDNMTGKGTPSFNACGSMGNMLGAEGWAM